MLAEWQFSACARVVLKEAALQSSRAWIPDERGKVLTAAIV